MKYIKPKITIIALVCASAMFLLSADPVYYVVTKGDTLYSIAKAHSVRLDDLMKANGIQDPSKLTLGTKLLIPIAGSSEEASSKLSFTYIVKKGDTLYSIAKQNGVSVDAVLKENSMSSSSIKVGQKIIIPSVANNVAAKNTSTPKEEKIVPNTSNTTKPTTETKTIVNPPIPKTVPLNSKANAKLWPSEGVVSSLQGKLKGVSIAVDKGASIKALRAGTVISAGPFRGFGQVAFVQSSDQLVYVYGGAAKLSVRVGDTIKKGSIIGNAETSDTRAVYFFVFKGSSTIDPVSAPRD